VRDERGHGIRVDLSAETVPEDPPVQRTDRFTGHEVEERACLATPVRAIPSEQLGVSQPDGGDFLPYAPVDHCLRLRECLVDDV